MKNNNRGFIQIILILIIILVILSLAGLDASKIWTGLFYPIFSFIGNIILTVAGFLTSIAKYAWAILEKFGA